MPIAALNPSFETGSLAPWVGFNAAVTPNDAHQGFFKAELAGQGLNSFIYQFIPVNPGDNGQLILSLAKDVEDTSPPVSVTVQYYDEGSTFLGYGLLQNIATDGLPVVAGQAWKTVYSLVDAVPLMAANALIVINALPTPESSKVLVDDVELVFF